MQEFKQCICFGVNIKVKVNSSKGATVKVSDNGRYANKLGKHVKFFMAFSFLCIPVLRNNCGENKDVETKLIQDSSQTLHKCLIR